MDYEKEYKEALERATIAYKDEDRHQKATLERIFPELAESEDEKIKKELIKLINCLTDSIVENYTSVPLRDFSSWLEKQGQVKESLISQYENKTCKESDDSLTSKDERIKKALIDYFDDANKADENPLQRYGVHTDKVIAWLEKQENKDSQVIFPNILWHDGNEEPEEQCEILCEWESKDAVWHDVAFYHADTKTFWNGGEKIEAVVRWIYVNDLLEKQGEQKPAWSEEDEKLYKSALWHIKNSCGNGGKNSGEFEVYNWLKSLKGRYTWKPSDEQMAALSDINCTGCISYAGQGQELINLYNDLKNLREE